MIEYLPYIWWALIITAAYSLIIVPIQMELAVAKPARGEDGVLRVKNGAILRLCFRGNCGQPPIMKYPANICELYRGLWWGNFSLLLWFVLSIVFGILMLVSMVVTTIIGFAPDLTDAQNDFHKYERFGKNDEKKFIAPWKLILLAFGLIFFKKILDFSVIVGKSSLNFLLSPTVLQMIAGIAVILLIGWIADRARKKDAWQATKEFLKSKKKKVCLEIEVVE